MSGPGVPRGARDLTGWVSRELESHIDLYPTVLATAGLAMPTTRNRDGRSLFDILTDTPGAKRDRIVVEIGTSVVVRAPSWKLVFDPEQGDLHQLFNLAADPAERDNLAGRPGYEHVCLDLISRLLEHRIRLTQSTHDKERHRPQRVRV